MDIHINPEICSGCRACEIACSYHHYRVFSRKRSSIVITRLIDTGKKEVRIIKNSEGFRPECDSCKGEMLPLCVKYCAPGALTVQEE